MFSSISEIQPRRVSWGDNRYIETNLVQEVVSVSSWGIQTPLEHTISMMKLIKILLYLEM